MTPVRRGARILNADHRPAQGTAPTLAFSNSLGTDLRIWDTVVAALPKDFGILRYDTAGHGLSSWHSPLSIDEHGADLIALLDAFGIDAAILVGLSVGGLIAQQIATVAPDRVAGLVLSNTAPMIGNAEMWAARIEQISAGGMEAIADATMERWFSPHFRQTQPDALALWRTMLMHTPTRGYTDLAAALRDSDLRGQIGGITAPTLCIAGSADGSTPPDVVKAMADAIPGAGYRELAGIGHLPAIEAPEDMTAAILTLVAEAHP